MGAACPFDSTSLSLERRRVLVGSNFIPDLLKNRTAIISAMEEQVVGCLM